MSAIRKIPFNSTPWFVVSSICHPIITQVPVTRLRDNLVPTLLILASLVWGVDNLGPSDWQSGSWMMLLSEGFLGGDPPTVTVVPGPTYLNIILLIFDGYISGIWSISKISNNFCHIFWHIIIRFNLIDILWPWYVWFTRAWGWWFQWGDRPQTFARMEATSMKLIADKRGSSVMVLTNPSSLEGVSPGFLVWIFLPEHWLIWCGGIA